MKPLPQTSQSTPLKNRSVINGTFTLLKRTEEKIRGEYEMGREYEDLCVYVCRSVFSFVFFNIPSTS